MSEAPAELWVRPWAAGWYETQFRDDPAAVRYVRADLYDKRMAENVTEAPCREPLGTDYPR